MCQLRKFPPGSFGPKGVRNLQQRTTLLLFAAHPWRCSTQNPKISLWLSWLGLAQHWMTSWTSSMSTTRGVPTTGCSRSGCQLIRTTSLQLRSLRRIWSPLTMTWPSTTDSCSSHIRGCTNRSCRCCRTPHCRWGCVPQGAGTALVSAPSWRCVPCHARPFCGAIAASKSAFGTLRNAIYAFNTRWVVSLRPWAPGTILWLLCFPWLHPHRQILLGGRVLVEVLDHVAAQRVEQMQSKMQGPRLARDGPLGWWQLRFNYGEFFIEVDMVALVEMCQYGFDRMKEKSPSRW